MEVLVENSNSGAKVNPEVNPIKAINPRYNDILESYSVDIFCNRPVE